MAGTYTEMLASEVFRTRETAKVLLIRFHPINRQVQVPHPLGPRPLAEAVPTFLVDISLVRTYFPTGRGRHEAQTGIFPNLYSISSLRNTFYFSHYCWPQRNMYGDA